MKKQFSAILLLVLLASATLSLRAQSTSDAALVGRAHSAVGSCIGAAHPLLGQGNGNGNNNGNQGGFTTSGLQHSVDVVSACFAGGFITRVTFYYVLFSPPCNPALDPDCRPGLPIYAPVATVDFGCDGAIIASECFVE